MTNFNNEGSKNDASNLRPRADNGSDPRLPEPRPDEGRLAEGIETPPRNSDGNSSRPDQVKIQAGTDRRIDTVPGQTSSREDSHNLAQSRPTVAPTVPSSVEKRLDGSNATSAPFTQTQPGDKLLSDSADLEGVDKNASQAYRDKYAETMRNFKAGTLRSALSHIVKDRDEARTIAADQAKQFDASTVRKAVL